MIVSCGEALVDFVPARDALGRPAFVPLPGGSPFNVAIAAARLGARVAFSGAVSNDLFGTLLDDALAGSGVGRELVERVGDPTPLAFVALADGEATYAFFDRGATYRRAGRIALPPETSIVHAGSLALAVEPAGESLATFVLAERGRRLLSLDPNIRPSFVDDEPRYRARLERLVAGCDIVKVSESDLEWLAPGASFESLAAAWLARGAGLVAITLGGEGVRAYRRAGVRERRAPAVRVIDTVGAGDTFCGAFLAALDRDGVGGRAALEAYDDDRLDRALDDATFAAALVCTRAGADSPTAAELAAYRAANPLAARAAHRDRVDDGSEPETADAEDDRARPRRAEEIDPADRGDDRRDGIAPHSIGRAAAARAPDDERGDLRERADEDAACRERRDDRIERKEAGR